MRALVMKIDNWLIPHERLFMRATGLIFLALMLIFVLFHVMWAWVLGMAMCVFMLGFYLIAVPLRKKGRTAVLRDIPPR